MAKQQERNDEIRERKIKDILLSPCVILNNNDNFEIFTIPKTKTDMFNIIPVLNLNLSGLVSNITCDVSSFSISVGNHQKKYALVAEIA